MLNKQPMMLFALCFCNAAVVIAADKIDLPDSGPARANLSPIYQGPSDESAPRVAAETSAAIEALGANPATKQVSVIVFKAVRSSPGSVLPIVHAATIAAPARMAPEIVTAATAAVPNPWKQVIYRRIRTVALKKSTPDFKGNSDFKGGPDGKRTVNLDGRGPDFRGGPGGSGIRSPGAGIPDDPNAGSGNGIPMLLAEAIAQTAFDARSDLSLSALQAAVDIALLGDPAVLMRNLMSPRFGSGVGDAGFSNFANEPIRTPVPPVVSR